MRAGVDGGRRGASAPIIRALSDRKQATDSGGRPRTLCGARRPLAPFVVLALASAAVGLGRWKERTRAARGGDAPRRGDLVSDAELADRLAAGLARADTASEAVERLLDELTSFPSADVRARPGRRGGPARVGASRSAARTRPGGEGSSSTSTTTPRASRRRPANGLPSASTTSRRRRIEARLTSAVGAKSVGFVPLVLEDRVVAVLVLAATAERRFFSSAGSRQSVGSATSRRP